MKICMAGAMGRMGRRILELAAQDRQVKIAGAFDLPEFSGQSYAIQDGKVTVTMAANAAEALAKADVLIDFTIASACLANVRLAVKAGKAAVVGTTGLTIHDRATLSDLARSAPIVFAPNMSVGVNLLFKLARDVAEVLGLDYNAEIIEIHHNQKVDSPSGTALRLAEQVAKGQNLEYPDSAAFGREGMVGKRPAREIGIHAIRGGDVVGEHTVAFIGQGERIELTHKAHSRDNLARGALVAAKFAVKAKPGLYDMQDVLGFK